MRTAMLGVGVVAFVFIGLAILLIAGLELHTPKAFDHPVLAVVSASIFAVGIAALGVLWGIKVIIKKHSEESSSTR